jgi:flagellar basal body rod protein FlgG
VTADGAVRQNGQTLGSLEIADFDDSSALVKQGASYFHTALASQPATAVKVEQGKLESSNVGAAESAVRLVAVMRQFEMLQKAATLGAQMNKQTIEEVARVAS